jgi:hypothetical protein
MLKKITLALLLAALIPLQSYARDYHVEAIIFTNTVPADREIVAWDDKAPRNIRAQNKLDFLYRKAVEATEAREADALLAAEVLAVAPAEPATTTDPLDETNSEQEPIKTEIGFELIELLKLQDKLEQSPDHEIIETLSWNQSEADYQTSPLINTLTPHMKGVIRIYAPNLLFAEVNLSYVPDEILQESLDKAAGEAETQTQPSPAPESELPTISFDTEFELQILPEPVIAHYFMEERRKLKLNEIHYFDHPNFGVILTVKPIEEPEAS